jgi:hypothetical protein
MNINQYTKETAAHLFTAALFTIAKWWNQPSCPATSGWVKKMWDPISKTAKAQRAGAEAQVVECLPSTPSLQNKK